MAWINWDGEDGSLEQLETKTTEIGNAQIQDREWRGFLHALGIVESTGNYNSVGPGGHVGIYQHGETLDYIHFYSQDGIGRSFLGCARNSDLLRNPIGQELAAVIEFSGYPKYNTQFVDQYSAVSIVADSTIDELLGETFNISYILRDGRTVTSNPVTITSQGIAAAAHNLGMGVLLMPWMIYGNSIHRQEIKMSTM